MHSVGKPKLENCNWICEVKCSLLLFHAHCSRKMAGFDVPWDSNLGIRCRCRESSLRHAGLLFTMNNEYARHIHEQMIQNISILCVVGKMKWHSVPNIRSISFRLTTLNLRHVCFHELRKSCLVWNIQVFAMDNRYGYIYT